MRKAKPKKRIVLPDPVFNDVKVSKFVNHLMYDGKKNTSYTIFYSALDIVKSKLPNEEKTALEIVDSFLKFDFAGGRHQRRIDMISAIEEGEYRE